MVLKDNLSNHRTHGLTPFGSPLKARSLDATEVHRRQDPLAWLESFAVRRFAVAIFEVCFRQELGEGCAEAADLLVKGGGRSSDGVSRVVLEGDC